MRSFLTCLLVIVGLLAGGAAFGQGFAQDEVCVKFKPGTPSQTRAAVHRANGGTVRDRVTALDVDVVAVPSGTVLQRATAYARNANVQYAEPNFIAVAFLTPTDTYYANGSLWGIDKIQAPSAWDLTSGAGIKVAVADTGIDGNHPDLAGQVVASRSFVPWWFGGGSTTDQNGHGTHVAGTIAAKINNGGVVGVAYGAKLMNAKVLNASGSGFHSWIANGITWAADNGAHVINLSLGGSSGSSTLYNAMVYARNKGVVLVAAAGNSNTSSPSYPAYYSTSIDSAIAVAATDQADNKASFSNFGSWVNVAAPGVGIWSTVPGGGWASYNGTSMACPHVAGTAALVRADQPGLTAAQVRAQIQNTCNNNGNTGSVYGRINAFNAVQ